MPKTLQPLRWTVFQAAQEFGFSEHTVTKRIRTEGIEAGEDKKFSTADIARAIFGDLSGERLRKTREEADKIALDNEKSRGRLVEAERVYRTYESVFVVLRQKILSLEIPDADKDELINELRALRSKVIV